MRRKKSPARVSGAASMKARGRCAVTLYLDPTELAVVRACACHASKPVATWARKRLIALAAEELPEDASEEAKRAADIVQIGRRHRR